MPDAVRLVNALILPSFRPTSHAISDNSFAPVFASVRPSFRLSRRVRLDSSDTTKYAVITFSICFEILYH